MLEKLEIDNSTVQVEEVASSDVDNIITQRKPSKWGWLYEKIVSLRPGGKALHITVENKRMRNKISAVAYAPSSKDNQPAHYRLPHDQRVSIKSFKDDDGIHIYIRVVKRTEYP